MLQYDLSVAGNACINEGTRHWHHSDRHLKNPFEYSSCIYGYNRGEGIVQIAYDCDWGEALKFNSDECFRVKGDGYTMIVGEEEWLQSEQSGDTDDVSGEWNIYLVVCITAA